MGENEITLSQAIEGYFIAARARRLSENTLVSYDYAFQKFEAFLGEGPAVTAITPSDIREFLNSLDGLAPESVLNHHIALSRSGPGRSRSRWRSRMWSGR